jgi:hypothetical protein
LKNFKFFEKSSLFEAAKISKRRQFFVGKGKKLESTLLKKNEEDMTF